MEWEIFVIVMTAIVFGGAIFLVPAVAFALSRGLKPLIETWAKTRQVSLDSAVEERLSRIEAVLGQVVAETEFQKQLRNPGADDGVEDT